MLVYSHRDREVSPPSLLADLRRDSAAAVRCRTSRPEAVVDLLIRAGELETTVVDAVCPLEDDDPPLARDCRRATMSAARALVAARAGDSEGAARALQALSCDLHAIEPRAVPPTGTHRTSEGYALFAVYPEMYADAAWRFRDELRPTDVYCIGIRSIGTSLSAVVAAALEQAGVRVDSVTLRPRGSPIERVVRATERLARAVIIHRHSYFAIVDEGPGMSGSTIAAVATWLRDRGVPDHRLILFASHPVDADSLGSPTARQVWKRSRVYAADFESLGLPARLAGAASATDVSAGAWRRHILPRGSPFPVTHPQHERRKFLIRDGRPVMLRFAGLGRYGAAVHARACALADAGFAPPVEELREGFLRLRFVPGRPATRNDVSAAFIERLARYAAHLRQHAPAPPERPSTSLEDMLLHNGAGVLDAPGAEALRRVLSRVRRFEAPATVAVDGRLMPHEWIATADGTFVKVDAFDHFRDDFFPGPADIAWDLAGASIEFELSPSADRYLVDRYRRLAHDEDVVRRLPFFRLAYLAYRAGYTAEAGSMLAGTADGRRFARLAEHYANRLRREVIRATTAPSAP
jgi:hypothetical protein